MTKNFILLLHKLVMVFTGFVIPMTLSSQVTEIKLQIDGAEKYQKMDGFGVNINPAWWYDGYRAAGSGGSLRAQG